MEKHPRRDVINLVSSDEEEEAEPIPATAPGGEMVDDDDDDDMDIPDEEDEEEEGGKEETQESKNRRIAKMYLAVKKATDLLPALDRASLDDATVPNTIRSVYGELTQHAFSRVLDVFIAAGMGKHDSFLDIGSGYGKPVFHAYMQTGAQCLGIEYIPMRVQWANQLRLELHLEKVAKFMQADITDLKRLNFDFIYFYDLRAQEIAPLVEEILMRSKFTLYASYVKPRKYKHLVKVFQITVATTGREHPTCYFYKRPGEITPSLPLPKRPRDGEDKGDVDEDAPKKKKTRYACWKCEQDASYAALPLSTRVNLEETVFFCNNPDCRPV